MAPGALIYKKLTDILKEVPKVPKGNKNKDGGYSFRGIYALYNALHPLFARHGVFISYEVLESSETVVHTQTGRQFRVKLKVKYRFTAEDGSSVEYVTQGEALDPGDKATNKALTACLKYLLSYSFLVPTDAYETDADYHSPVIKPFETEDPKSLLALAESRGMTREQLMELGKKLGIDPDKDLSADDRRKLYFYIKNNIG